MHYLFVHRHYWKIYTFSYVSSIQNWFVLSKTKQKKNEKNNLLYVCMLFYRCFFFFFLLCFVSLVHSFTRSVCSVVCLFCSLILLFIIYGMRYGMSIVCVYNICVRGKFVQICQLYLLYWYRHQACVYVWVGWWGGVWVTARVHTHINEHSCSYFSNRTKSFNYGSVWVWYKTTHFMYAVCKDLQIFFFTINSRDARTHNKNWSIDILLKMASK